MTNLVSERTIEDILGADKGILAELLDCNFANLSIISRQKIVSSGRLDLLCLYENELWLIELKVVPFYDDIIPQINNYETDLLALQAQHKLINAPIKKIILITGANENDLRKCSTHNVFSFIYDPRQVLDKYFENFRERTAFINIQSGDYGVVRLGLLCTSLKLLSQGKSIEDIAMLEGKSTKTIRNRFSIAEQLGLIQHAKNQFFLTDLGNSFVESGDEFPENQLNDNQQALLTSFVIESPFFSSATYTILSFVETVFTLAKSKYPVDIDDAKDYFVKTVGKESTWKSSKSRNTATYIFSNYACDLQLMTKIANEFYITPKGIRAILLLQLNRSIKLIEKGN